MENTNMFSFTPRCGGEVFDNNAHKLGIIVEVCDNFVLVGNPDQVGLPRIQYGGRLPAVMTDAVAAWDVFPGIVNGSIQAIAGASFEIPSNSIAVSSSYFDGDEGWDDDQPSERLVIIVNAPSGALDELATGCADLRLQHYAGDPNGRNWSDLAALLPAHSSVLVLGESLEWETAGEFASRVGPHPYFEGMEDIDPDTTGVDTATCVRILNAREAARKAREEGC